MAIQMVEYLATLLLIFFFREEYKEFSQANGYAGGRISGDTALDILFQGRIQKLQPMAIHI